MAVAVARHPAPKVTVAATLERKRFEVRTLGVDLSSQPKACEVSWSLGEARIEVFELGVDDERLVSLIDGADKVALHVPFGWPDAFVDAIDRHHHSKAWPSDADNRAVRFRRTDLFVWEHTGRPPLSVSSDGIALPAFRAARLLSRYQIDRTGNGLFVEVYPRAARDRFSLSRTRAVEELLTRAPYPR